MSRTLGIEVEIDDGQAVKIAKQVAYESDNLAAVCDIARNAIYKLREVDPARLDRMLKREFNAVITFGPNRSGGKKSAVQVTEEDSVSSGAGMGWRLRD